jgi:ketosteroid isomerase-like protein
MSRENVQIAREMSAAFNRGDVEGWLGYCAPDFEVHDLPELPGSGVAVGHDAVRAWRERLFETFEEFHVDAENFIDAGNCVAIVNHVTGRGGASGADVEMHFTSVLTLSGGKAISLASFSDHSEALEATRLRE